MASRKTGSSKPKPKSSSGRGFTVDKGHHKSIYGTKKGK